MLQTQAEFLFRGLMEDFPMPLYGQRIWYKLPYEKMKDLKILGNASDTFRLMCEAARCTNFVEIYMELEHDNIMYITEFLIIFFRPKFLKVGFN